MTSFKDFILEADNLKFKSGFTTIDKRSDYNTKVTKNKAVVKGFTNKKELSEFKTLLDNQFGSYMDKFDIDSSDIEKVL